MCARIRIVVVVTLAAGAFPLLARQSASYGALTGLVNDVSGKPAAGATVKARHPAKGMTVTVFSQEDGRYRFPKLPVGQYQVEALGGGFQVAAEIKLRGGETAQLNLSLTSQQALRDALTSSDYAASMPEAPGKDRVIALCTVCHKRGLQTPMSKRFDREGWRAIIEVMRNKPFGHSGSLNVTDAYRDVIVDYLGTHFGPQTPLASERDMPRRWVRGPAARAVITEFELQRGAEPHDVTVDFQGIGWAVEQNFGMLVRVDPPARTYTRIQIPGEKPNAHVLTVDEQNGVWLSDGRNGRLLRYDSKAQKFDVFPLPKSARGSNGSAHDAELDSDGALWGTDAGNSRILRLDPVTKTATEYPFVTRSTSGMITLPYGLAIGAHNTPWFTANGVDTVGRVDVKTGEVIEYELPTPRANPRRMGADVDGNLWFGEYAVGKMARIDGRSAKITEYPTPTKHSGPYFVSVDKVNNLVWFSETLAEQLGRLDPRTNEIVEFPLPTPYASMRRIEVDRNRPTRVWFSGNWSGKVGFLDAEGGED